MAVRRQSQVGCVWGGGGGGSWWRMQPYFQANTSTELSSHPAGLLPRLLELPRRDGPPEWPMGVAHRYPGQQGVNIHTFGTCTGR